MKLNTKKTMVNLINIEISTPKSDSVERPDSIPDHRAQNIIIKGSGDEKIIK